MRSRHWTAGIGALVLAVALAGVPARAATSAARAAAYIGEPGVLQAVDFRSPTRGWIGGVGTILATPDGGQTWTRQYAGTATITQFSFVSDKVGWALGTDTLLQTTDGGLSWLGVGEPNAPLTQIDFVTATQGWGVAGTTLYHTHDGGMTWQMQHTPVAVGSACFVGKRHGWVATDHSTGHANIVVAATTDGGASWHATALPPGTGGINSFEKQVLGCAAPDKVWDLVLFGGYAGGVAYALYRGPDGGAHWRIAAKNMAPPNTPAPNGPGTEAGALAVTSGAAAHLAGTCFPCGAGTTLVGGTTNGAQSWQNYTVSGLPAATTGLSFPTPQDGWLVATWPASPSEARSILLQTTDGGRSWQQRYPLPRGMALVTFTLALYGRVPSGQEFAVAGPRALGGGTGTAVFCTSSAGQMGPEPPLCIGETGMVYVRAVEVAQGSTLHFAFERFTGAHAAPRVFFSGTRHITGNAYISAYFRFPG